MPRLFALALLTALASAAGAQEVIRETSVPTLRVERDTLRPEFGRFLPGGDLLVSGTLMRTHASTGEPYRTVGAARVTVTGSVGFADEIASTDGSYAMQQPYPASGGLVAVPIRPGRPGSRLAVAMLRPFDGRQMASPRFSIAEGLSLRALIPDPDNVDDPDGGWLGMGVMTLPDSSQEGRLLRFDSTGGLLNESPLPFPPGFQPFARGHVLGDTSFVVAGAMQPGPSLSPVRPLPLVAWTGGGDRSFGVTIKSLWTITGEMSSAAVRDHEGGIWVGGTSGDLFTTTASIGRRGPGGRTWTLPLLSSGGGLLSSTRLAGLAEVPGGAVAITTPGLGGFGFGGTPGFSLQAFSPEGAPLWEIRHELSGSVLLGPYLLDARHVGRNLRVAYLTEPGLRSERLHLLDIRLP